MSEIDRDVLAAIIRSEIAGYGITPSTAEPAAVTDILALLEALKPVVVDREAMVEAGAKAIHRWDKKPVTWDDLRSEDRLQYSSEAAVVVDAVLAAFPAPTQPVVDREALWEPIVKTIHGEYHNQNPCRQGVTCVRLGQARKAAGPVLTLLAALYPKATEGKS